jgi:hypothetical protein
MRWLVVRRLRARGGGAESNLGHGLPQLDLAGLPCYGSGAPALDMGGSWPTARGWGELYMGAIGCRMTPEDQHAPGRRCKGLEMEVVVLPAA